MNQLEVEVIEDPRFIIKHGGRQIKSCRRLETWHGLTSYETPEGHIIILAPTEGAMEAAMHAALGSIFGGGAGLVHFVIKADVRVLGALFEEQAK